MTDDNTELPRDVFDGHIGELVDAGFLVCLPYGSDDGHALYKARTGLAWSEVKDQANPIKQAILLRFIENPKTTFILFNTQKGKAKLSAQKIVGWQQASGKKIVSFVVVTNDTTLGDQTLESYLGRIGRPGTAASPPRGVFLLSSSNGKHTVDQIITYIDAYRANDDYPMPLILALPNDKQIAKVLTIMAHVRGKHMASVPSGGVPLCYAVVFDEADSTYPPLREKFAPFLVDDTTALHELVFVSATDGTLLDDDYPECANALLLKSELDPEDVPFYRAYHTEDAIHMPVLCPTKSSNNGLALDMLRTHDAYWKTPISLPGGGTTYRKLIVNANARGEDMRSFAVDAVAMGYDALVFNQTGLTLHRHGVPPVRVRTKGHRFNELLFYMTKRFELTTKPLILVGRRKVDRGLGFHYAPRRNALGPTTLDHPTHGPITTDGKEGLIWTDMFLGRIVCKDTAVQKAGRLAGIIAHCPQYPGALTWWVDDLTGKQILRHNRIVDELNGLAGSHTALQAKTTAAASHPMPRIENPYSCSETFSRDKDAFAWAATHINWTHEDLVGKTKPIKVTPCDPTGGSSAKTHMSSRNHRGANPREPIVSRVALLDSGDLSRWGESVRCVPVLSGTGLQWVIVYKRVWEKEAAVGGAGVGNTVIHHA